MQLQAHNTQRKKQAERQSDEEVLRACVWS